MPEHLIAGPPPAGPNRSEEECRKLIAERLAGTDERKQFGARAIGQILGELGADSKVEVSRSEITPTPEGGPVLGGLAASVPSNARKLWKN